MSALCVMETAACTAIGLSSAAAAAAVRSAISGFAEYALAPDRLGSPVIVAAPPGIAGIVDPAAAMAEMAFAALTRLADGRTLPVFLALPEARPGFGSDLGQRIAAELADRVPGCRVALSDGAGHAGAASAISRAGDWLDHNRDAVIAVVGADSHLHPDTIDWLDRNRQLHATYNAWGFIPGAAAGACLLCHPDLARSRGQPPRAIIEAVALDHEEVPIKTDGVCLGRAMSRIVDTLLVGQPAGAVFDAFYCDQNGEAYRADEMGFMLARAAGRFRNPSDFISPADCWGDVGAASVPLYIALAIEAASRGYAPGPVSLILAGSESGLRAGLRLRTPLRDA